MSTLAGFPRRTLRIAVTGLARSGKTAFLTAIAANLLALGAGMPVLPAVMARLNGRRLRVAIAPAGAAAMPRFDHAAHLAALAADPPEWPARTDAASLLAFELETTRSLFGLARPHRLRLEFLDYPGEWLLDLPLLQQSFATWSQTMLRRLQDRPEAADFVGFVAGLPAGLPADEALAATGHRLYRTTLQRLRDAGYSTLQPGRFLMPAPGASPPWLEFFPLPATGGLVGLLARRYDAYVDAVRRDLVTPLFGQPTGLIVLADVLSALHAGPEAFADMRRALGLAAESLRWQRGWPDLLAHLRALRLPPPAIRRVVFAATKADQVADRQRGNLAALMQGLVALPDGRAAHRTMALSAIRCTEDFVWTLEGRPVSAVRGRVVGSDRMTRSYPGEVPDKFPEAGFWAHRFLALPDFEPARLPASGRGGVAHLGLDILLADLLEDFL